MTIFRSKKLFLKRRKWVKLFIFILMFFFINKFFVVETIIDLFLNHQEIICNQEMETDAQNLTIHLLDVGQSEAILVTQGDQVMLIDTGLPQYGNAICKYLKKLNISRINRLILTHPHIDHIGGASKIIRTFAVDKVYFADTRSIFSIHNFFYLNIRRVCWLTGVPIEYSQTGAELSFAKSTLQFVAPIRHKYRDLNDYSVGIKLKFGKISALLLGDVQAEAEEDLIASGFKLDCDILKISHHGSSKSSTMEFLDEVNPTYALLSVGCTNTYGHPTKTVMRRFQSRNIPIYRTDELGTIILTTNGEDIWFNTEAGDYKYRKKS